MFSILFFSKIMLLWYIVKTFCRAGQATDENMAYAHCMLNTKDYKYTIRICNTYCFPLQQWLQERALGLRYTYIVYFVKTVFLGRVYRKAAGRWHTNVIAHYFWPYETRMNIMSGPALQRILSALYHAIINFKYRAFHNVLRDYKNVL